ncbi:MAG: MoaD/ThiS family protein [Spiribacter sp.]|jgi:molybdopterin converting factor small subunit|nr:MoaD/ThiS family protein [Spiribacter sp.]MDR9488890.1 MoaD/ThiS family protein [Spiribacter sp.]
MKVELFGVLREVAGASDIALSIELPASITQVLAALVSQYPALEPHLPQVACAVGESMRSRHASLYPNETLVLLPPVSGG